MKKLLGIPSPGKSPEHWLLQLLLIGRTSSWEPTDLHFKIILMISKHWLSTCVSGDANNSVPLSLFNQSSILPFAAMIRFLLFSMHQ